MGPTGPNAVEAQEGCSAGAAGKKAFEGSCPSGFVWGLLDFVLNVRLALRLGKFYRDLFINDFVCDSRVILVKLINLNGFQLHSIGQNLN